jgi:NTP pyrophosphatase (non-canonical NTP hydrolase)
VTPAQYQIAAWAFARSSIREGDAALDHAAFGLVAEVGEVAGLFQKSLRDSVPVDVDRLVLELGDVLWYAAACATLQRDELFVARREQPWVRAEDVAPGALGAVLAYAQHPSQVAAWVRDLAVAHGRTLDEVQTRNLDKLGRRAATGTIGGSGEDRAAAVASERAAVVRYLQHLPEVCAACCDAALSDAIDSIDAGAHREQS